MGDGDVWCKSGRVPIRAGDYLLGGRTLTVRRSRTGKFYASRDGKYVPGLIWQLRADLGSRTGLGLVQAEHASRHAE